MMEDGIRPRILCAEFDVALESAEGACETVTQLKKLVDYGYDLLHAKRELPGRLEQILPSEVVCNDLLMQFIHGLISPDPNRRFSSA